MIQNRFICFYFNSCVAIWKAWATFCVTSIFSSVLISNFIFFPPFEWYYLIGDIPPITLMEKVYISFV